MFKEQVEKVWRGCEYCAGDVNDRPYLDSKEIYIYDDGILMNGYESACKILFCPKCGRPLTDEALEITMKRLEELRND